MARFKLEKSTQHPGRWVCTDTENMIVCRWRDHQFNDTQKVTMLNDNQNPDVMALARAMREMGDWLGENHHDKVF